MLERTWNLCALLVEMLTDPATVEKNTEVP